MNDPFAKGGTGLLSKLRGREGEEPQSPAQPPPADFPKIKVESDSAPPASPAKAAHPRTVSEDIDDHMDGSVHQGTDVCPSCGYVRMSSIYCSVSLLHHGTDLPAQTPNRKKNSIFSRIRDSMSGLTPLGGDSDREDAAGNSAPTTEAAGFTLFAKSKEEKQLVELVQQEEKGRKAIVDVVRLSATEIERQLTVVHKDFREMLKSHEKARNNLAVVCKTEFDKMYSDRKRELEDLRKDFATETKLVAKKEKERRKHQATAGPETEAPAPAVLDVFVPVAAAIEEISTAALSQ